MHHLSIPERRDHHLPRDYNLISSIMQWGEQRLRDLEQAGIDRQRIIFDPGIGFGKLAEQSLTVLQKVNTFTKLNTPILIGHSRKSFMSSFTQYPSAERDIETIAISLALANKNIDYLRVHHVDLHARAFKAAALI